MTDDAETTALALLEIFGRADLRALEARLAEPAVIA